MQLVFYRGFNECKASKWLSTAPSLHGAMRAVFCIGGETQIARVLRHALKAARDAEDRRAGLCRRRDGGKRSTSFAASPGSSACWACRFSSSTRAATPAAARAFKDIARLSHGAYCRFDANSAGELRALLGAVAAYAAGGHRALANYSKNAGGAALLHRAAIGRGVIAPMAYLIIGVALLGCLLLTARMLVNADPAKLGRTIGWFTMGLGLAGAGALIIGLIASERLGPGARRGRRLGAPRAGAAARCGGAITAAHRPPAARSPRSRRSCCA